MSTNVALIANKVGMTTSFTPTGECLPVTWLKVNTNSLIGVRTIKKDGYNAIIISGGVAKKNKNISKPQLKVFEKAKISPSAVMKEFRLSNFDDSNFENLSNAIGVSFGVSELILGMYVDVSGVTMGKGFQGVVKRYGFAGQESSHGVSVAHRSHGATGSRQDPGKVFKGKKMAGRMGATKITVQNLKIVEIDMENQMIAVSGSVPGFSNAVLCVRNAVKYNLGNFSTINGSDVIGEAIKPAYSPSSELTDSDSISDNN